MALLDDIAGAVMQQSRLLKLTTPLGDGVLQPERAIGHSRLGRHFEFTVDLLSTDPDIQLKSLIAQPVTLWIQQSDKTYQPHNGYVHTAKRLGSDGALCSYQLTLASWLHFLKFRRDQRTWNDKRVVDILSDIFDQHPQAAGRYRFALKDASPTRSYCRQDETDWNFVHRTMEFEGWYGCWEQAEDGNGHTLVIRDNLSDIGTISPAKVSFYRADINAETDTLTQWSGVRSLHSSAYTTRTYDYKDPSAQSPAKGTQVPTLPNQGTLPGQTEIFEYTGSYTYSAQSRGDALSRIRMEEWESRAKRFFGSGGVRGADAGKRFTLQDHPVHDVDPSGTKEFVFIDVKWTIENNISTSDASNDYPLSLQSTIARARASQAAARGVANSASGALVSSFASRAATALGGSVTNALASSGSDGFFLVEIEAQRTTVAFRSPFEHPKPESHLETAIVVTQGAQEVYTDSLNRVRVLFPWDRLHGRDESGSCWVRIAQSHAGKGYGHVQQPRAGEEVLIDYIGGDIDRPVIIARLYNGASTPQWHTNGLLSGYRSKEYSGDGYNQLVMDDATGQNRAQLYSSAADTGLHLGYQVAHEGNTRGQYLGSGFDLKSQAYGAIRATQGLFVSTYATSGVQPYDATEARTQLTSVKTLVERMSTASSTNQAESLDSGKSAAASLVDATQHKVSGAGGGGGGSTAGGGTGDAAGFSRPVIVISSPESVAVSSQQTAQLSCSTHVNIVSGENTHVVAGQSLLASVAEKISIFVQNAGMKLFAAKGPVQIQAQSDAMTLKAAQDLTISSTEGKIVISASKEIWIGAGGSYIKIGENMIEHGTPGDLTFKSQAFSKVGPAMMRVNDSLRSTAPGC